MHAANAAVKCGYVGYSKWVVDRFRAIGHGCTRKLRVRVGNVLRHIPLGKRVRPALIDANSRNDGSKIWYGRQDGCRLLNHPRVVSRNRRQVGYQIILVCNAPVLGASPCENATRILLAHGRVERSRSLIGPHAAEYFGVQEARFAQLDRRAVPHNVGTRIQGCHSAAERVACDENV